MLQQTRVGAVLPRYEKFLHRFPSVQKLAEAKVAGILAEWSGLGYYHRARNLHAAAKMIVRERDGNFPRDAGGWRELPGIGRYTAAAIASIAFDEPIAVLDGNVERVLRRLYARHVPALESWKAAERLLDRTRPGDFNQALMELGGTICVPGEPLCAECPIKRFCRTRGRGEARRRKPRQTKASAIYALARRGSSVFLIQRSGNESLMPGMWELPRIANPNDSNVLFRLRHSITVTDYRVTVVMESPADHAEGNWVRISRVHTLPLTGLAKKILQRAKIIQ